MSIHRKAVGLLCVIAVVGAAGVCFARSAPPAAVLTDVVGQVAVTRADTSLQVTTALPLSPGDRVRTGAGASARILFPNRPPVVLGPNARHAVGQEEQARAGDRQTAVTGQVWNAIVTRLRSAFVGERATRAGAARGDYDPTVSHPVYPCNTMILETTPRFEWTPVDDAESYEVSIGFYDTYERICTVSSRERSVDYPADAEPLQPGRKYFWCVQSAGATGVISEVVWFKVIDDVQRERYSLARESLADIYDAETAAWQQAAGLIAADFGLHALAADYLKAALDAGEDTPALRRIFADVLETMEFQSLAAKVSSELPEITDDELRGWGEIKFPAVDEER